MTDATPARIVTAGRVVPGAYFLLRADAPQRTPFVPVVGEGPYRHCFTYEGGGSTIKDELLSMIEAAAEKIFIGALVLGDADLRHALIRAATRMRGGVYIVSSLDNRGLEKAINDYDDVPDVDVQVEHRNFRELTRHGISVRGYPGLHAKFVVVDDRIALVSSANLVTSAFERVGENGVVLTDPGDVLRLARFFSRLWQLCPWEMPPDREHHAVQSRRPRERTVVPLTLGNGPVWTWNDELGIRDAVVATIDSAVSDLVLATFSIANITFPIRGADPSPELLFEPVERAVARGSRVRLLLRGRNHLPAARGEAAAFASIGAEIVPDRLNHAKAVIADGRRGALFSANFVAGQGLTGGVEVGARLDGIPALAEAARYFEHAMSEANMTFAVNPTLGELADGLYAEALSHWDRPRVLTVTAEDLDWKAFDEDHGPVLYTRHQDGMTVLHSGRRQWLLEERDGALALSRHEDGHRTSAEAFEGWLTRERTPDGVRRGLSPATFERTPREL